jgi:hypothetical protein
MRIEKVNINQIKKSNTFIIQYHLDIEPIHRKYLSLLNKTFKDSIKIPLSQLTNKIVNNVIEKGDVIIKNFPDGRLVFEIAKTITKGKSNWIRYRIIDKRVSPEYLLWFLSKKEIMHYLSIHATGSVIRVIPPKFIEELSIPLPTVINLKNRRSKLSLSYGDSSIRKIIQSFYQDYQENFDMNRFDTAIILAGAICEAILYESLIELGVSEKILSQNKTLGQLIEFAQIKELDSIYGINLTHFESIKQQRNKTVHIGSALKRLENGEILDKSIFREFDNIIKIFGI